MPVYQEASAKGDFNFFAQNNFISSLQELSQEMWGQRLVHGKIGILVIKLTVTPEVHHFKSAHILHFQIRKHYALSIGNMNFTTGKTGQAAFR